MNKKRALVILVENSLIFTDEQKKEILQTIPQMNDEHVEQIGSFFRYEMEFRDKNQDEIMRFITDFVKNRVPPKQ